MDDSERRLEKEMEEDRCDAQYWGVTVDEYEAIDWAQRMQTQEEMRVREWENDARKSEMDRMYRKLMQSIGELKADIVSRDRLITSQLEEIAVLQQLNREQSCQLDEKLEYEEYLLGCIFEFENK